MGSYVSCLYEKEWYDVLDEQVSVEEKNVLVKFLNTIDPSVSLHWPLNAGCVIRLRITIALDYNC